MATPRVLILRAPGTNCDLETEYAFELAGATCDRVHINRLLDNPALPNDFQILCIPGGFSYGDDLAAGRILGGQIQHHLRDTLLEMKSGGKLILGICNGFQVLARSGLLLPDGEGLPPATLTWNDSGRFEDRWVHLAVDGDKCVFFDGIESLYLPIAHAEGKFVARDEATLEALDAAGQLVLRYTTVPAAVAVGAAASPGIESDSPLLPFPANPNGSQANVAGVCDETGRVLGLMPHPERHVDPTQHPRWTRGEARIVGEGLAIFQNAVGYFR